MKKSNSDTPKPSSSRRGLRSRSKHKQKAGVGIVDDDFINPPNNPAGEETSMRTRDEENEQTTLRMKKKRKVVKRKYVSYNSDDDYVEPPNNPAGEETSKRRRDEENEQTTKERKKMKKKEWVRLAGFGGLLNFGLKELPHMLGYQILQSFDSESVALNLPRGSISITEEDVHQVMGLPLGMKVIPDSSTGKSSLVDAWRDQFKDRYGWKITPGAVADKLKQTSDVNLFFKLNFLVLVHNIMIQSFSNPYVNQRILVLGENVDQCCSYNWCSFLIDSMIESQHKWKVDPTKQFYTGPLVFLILFYADRVLFKGRRLVERTTPTFIGWTDWALKERQSEEISTNSFGKGAITERVELAPSSLPTGNSPKSVDTIRKDCIDRVQRRAAELESAKERYDAECETMRKLFPNDNELLQIQQRVSNVLVQGCGHRVSTCNDETAERNIVDDTPNMNTNVSRDMHASPAVDPTSAEIPQTQVSPNFIQEVDKIIETVSKKKDERPVKRKLSECGTPQTEEPSFSLGLTQDTENETVEMVDIVQVAKQVESEVTDDPVKRTDKQVEDAAAVDECKHKKVEVTENKGDAGRRKEKRMVKPATSLRSPWVQRVSQITARQSQLESIIWNWVHREKARHSADDSDEEEDFEVVFKWRQIECFLLAFKTFLPDEDIEANLISIWSNILNNREKMKSENSPLRFFCNVETTFCNIHKTDEANDELRYSRFASRMDEQLALYPHMKFNEIDMVFFPINAFEHFYIVCYGLKNPSMELIDNSKNCPDYKEKYQGRPEGL
ncbi:uncharacterized protein LOC109828330, partial [Asparagus officinalis]|uniref:uncharacterized protein LOC109828330 n=1 Tax=Asparagus officinalis TaxID=4686 RepID=UPI00098E2878